MTRMETRDVIGACEDLLEDAMENLQAGANGPCQRNLAALRGGLKLAMAAVNDGLTEAQRREVFAHFGIELEVKP